MLRAEKWMKESFCLSELPVALARLDLLSLPESLGASLVAQRVKNPPVMRDTWVQSMDQKIPWRRERLPAPVF